MICNHILYIATIFVYKKRRHNVTSPDVSIYRPCFVPVICRYIFTFGNHLSKFVAKPYQPSLQFARLAAPTKSLGCPLAGFTSSQTLAFTNVYVSMAPSGLLRHSLSLSLFDRRDITAPGFILYPSTNTTTITGCASMDLPHVRNITRNYPMLTKK